MSQWVFEELRGAAVRRDPKEAELFKTEQAEEDEYAGTDALVREVIQNSIDADDGDGKVHVRIAIHDAEEAPNAERLTHYFHRLRRPLKELGVEFVPGGAPQLAGRFLVCEDFGTRGLEGNPLLFQDPPRDQPSDEGFYWFWRNIGRSGKTGDDLGRWGLGKTVFRAASRVRCMLGLSVRRSDQQPLLMGQTVLRIHFDDGKQYQPEGYWCSAQDENGLPLAIDDEESVRAFASDWKLTRTNEPGLSIVTPYVPAELRADRVLQAVAVNFFARILRGELTVEVVGPELGSVTLDRDGLEAACGRIEWIGPTRTKRHAAPPVAFAHRCLGHAPDVATELLGTHGLPDFSVAFAENTLVQLRTDFADGKFIAVRVRIALPRRSGDAQEGHVDVFVQRAEDGGRRDTYYVREGMTITKLNSRAGLRGVQAIVNIDQGPMAELLGDTEGPAHEDWNTSADLPDQEWKAWKGRVRFVRRIVDALVELLTPPTTQPDFDLLSEFFSIPEHAGPRPQRQPGKEPGEPGGFQGVKVTPKWYRISERAGGFTISRDGSVPLPDQPSLKVALAYDIPKGSPLKNWSRFDFDLANGHRRPTGHGVKPSLYRNSGNMMRLDITEDQFQFSLDGFDQNRDLFVRVDEVPDDEETEL